MPSPDSTFYLCGATASGKSSVAVELCRRIQGEIVNADAFQLYYGLDVCTAKPGVEERTAAPHQLYSILHPTETCDAQRYHDLASTVIESIAAQGKWPIVVGGSGLYVKGLTHGLAPLPRADEVIRANIAQLTPEARVTELLRLDSDAFGNVPLSNDRYVSRALEICILTGQPQSKLRQTWAGYDPCFKGVLLVRERDDLYSRINQRVHQMVKGGAIDEVRELLSALGRTPGDISGVDQPPKIASILPDHGVFKAIGVKQIAAYLWGERSLEETIADIQQATRRYAKRQATWFRRERGFQTVCLTPDSTAESAVERILDLFPCLLQPPPPSVPSSLT